MKHQKSKHTFYSSATLKYWQFQEQASTLFIEQHLNGSLNHELPSMNVENMHLS